MNNLEILEGDSLFFDITKFSDKGSAKIIKKYKELKQRTGRQRRNVKTTNEIIEILNKEALHVSEQNSILLPRDLRRFGKVYRCSQPTFVSTNFFIIKGLSEQDSKLLASWMTTIFYQLCCERYGKNQEGTRKMERGELFKTLIPELSKLTEEEKVTILREGSFENFLDLQNPEIRNVDLVWANVLFGEAGELVLNSAVDLLQRKATNRNR